MVRSRATDAEIEQRRQELLRLVIERQEVRIDNLTTQFGVSPMTIHRDLDDLAERGLLRKLRGKAAAYPTLTMETSKQFREGLNLASKEALCARAVMELTDGQTVFVDDSTTLFPLVRRMAEMTGLTVVTNSLEAARILGRNPGTNTVQLLGGRYTDFDSCIGPDTISALRNIHAEIGFVSATSLSEGRLFHPDREYAELKITALESCRRNILLVDRSKFGRAATFAYGDVRGYDLLIAERTTSHEELDAIRQLGVPVELVEEKPSQVR